MLIECSVCQRKKGLDQFYFVTVKGKKYKRKQCKPCYQIRNNKQSCERYHKQTKQWLSWKSRLK